MSLWDCFSVPRYEKLNYFRLLFFLDTALVFEWGGVASLKQSNKVLEEIFGSSFRLSAWSNLFLWDIFVLVSVLDSNAGSFLNFTLYFKNISLLVHCAGGRSAIVIVFLRVCLVDLGFWDESQIYGDVFVTRRVLSTLIRVENNSQISCLRYICVGLFDGLKRRDCLIITAIGVDLSIEIILVPSYQSTVRVYSLMYGNLENSVCSWQ